MSADWTTRGDLATVVDDVEEVTLCRYGSTTRVEIPAALRSVVRTEEHEPSSGAVTSIDVTWEFDVPESVKQPAVGDSLSDSEGECWLIVRVEALRLSRRVRCSAQKLRLREHIKDRVTIEVDQQTHSEQPSAEPAWVTVRANLPARIELLTVDVDHASDPPAVVKRYAVYLSEDVLLDANHRLTDASGRSYSVEAYSRTGGLGVVIAVETADV